MEVSNEIKVATYWPDSEHTFECEIWRWRGETVRESKKEMERKINIVKWGKTITSEIGGVKRFTCEYRGVPYNLEMDKGQVVLYALLDGIIVKEIERPDGYAVVVKRQTTRWDRERYSSCSLFYQLLVDSVMREKYLIRSNL